MQLTRMPCWPSSAAALFDAMYACDATPPTTAATLPLLMMLPPQRVLYPQEHPGEVDAQHPGPVAVDDGGVIEHDVEAAVLGDGQVDGKTCMNEREDYLLASESGTGKALQLAMEILARSLSLSLCVTFSEREWMCIYR
ncbi:unnamed protein product [Musa acuminata subsp. burmannicoides]